MEQTEQKKPKRRKVGRPRLPKGEAKAKMVPLRLTPGELQAFTRAAKAGKLTLSAWIRARLNEAVGV